MNVIETTGLGKRYRGTWAMRECTLAVPEGHVVALVGPNGAGKTTLLNMSVGLTTPTVGRATVLGGQLAGSAAALDGTAFVAQDAPLYQNLSAADMLHLTRNVNRRWDQGYAEGRLAELGIPLKKKTGKLSGGQQAQLALTLALARRPRLLVLDEPLAMLDPLARHDFMASVMAAAGKGEGEEGGLSVVLSSHALAELERVADYLILLSGGRVQVAGEVDDLLACHRVTLRGWHSPPGRWPPSRSVPWPCTPGSPSRPRCGCASTTWPRWSPATPGRLALAMRPCRSAGGIPGRTASRPARP
ncbi:MAG TPA: ABC transporter ATP-binding protein [Streptosporangiaceae bacterium]|nr:ABC transporter ATP-binding protein [Streptosporangiaceae bacterium]